MLLSPVEPTDNLLSAPCWAQALPMLGLEAQHVLDVMDNSSFADLLHGTTLGRAWQSHGDRMRHREGLGAA